MARNDNNESNWGIYSFTTGNSTGVDEAKDLTLVKIYPNPSKDFAMLSISLKNSSFVTIRVTDITGRTIISVPELYLAAGANDYKLDFRGIDSGIYFVTVRTGSGIKVLRTVVEK